MQSFVEKALIEARAALDHLAGRRDLTEGIAKVAATLTRVFREGGRVYSCGNGGSMCDAMHFAEELSGRFRRDRAPLPALAISDPGHLSCTANDFGWEHVFSRFLEGHARAGDALLAISTSGKSANVLRAAEAARARGVTVIALTGPEQSQLAALADIELAVWTGPFADRTQELHIKVIHIVIEMIERELFPENYR